MRTSGGTFGTVGAVGWDFWDDIRLGGGLTWSQKLNVFLLICARFSLSFIGSFNGPSHQYKTSPVGLGTVQQQPEQLCRPIYSTPESSVLYGQWIMSMKVLTKVEKLLRRGVFAD